jgi:hypothetical protein
VAQLDKSIEAGRCTFLQVCGFGWRLCWGHSGSALYGSVRRVCMLRPWVWSYGAAVCWFEINQVC